MTGQRETLPGSSLRDDAIDGRGSAATRYPPIWRVPQSFWWIFRAAAAQHPV